MSRRAAVAALVLFAAAARAQLQEQHSGGGAERSTPGTERREPWPLRPDPAPELDTSGCPASTHYVVRVGNLTLRLGPDVGWTAFLEAGRSPIRSSGLPRCGDGRALHATGGVYFAFASTTGLPRDCWVAGVPPGPDGPACGATPEGLHAGRRYFALGLPGDITIDERPARAAASGGDDGLGRLTIRRRTPLGNEELRAPVPSRPDLDGGYPTYRLPRTGEGAEALGPLLVECQGVRWPDPIPPARIPYAQICSVVFDAPHAGVRVIYRFPREVYDEPDWQALDLRVREWIAARTVAEGPR